MPTADYFQKNKKNASKEQVEQMAQYIDTHPQRSQNKVENEDMAWID